MKQLILIAFSGFLLSTISCAQTSDADAIQQTVTAFAQAGDKNDATDLDKYLDDNYRVVMNRLFGSDQVSIVDKQTYLSKIKNKEWGGDKRQLSFESIVVNGNTASTQVTFKGAKMTFVSLVTLIKDEKGDWKLLSELPIVI